MNTKQNQSGQILLVVVLLLATTLTIVMTAVFTSRTETQVSKLQQESDKSLIAAEAGIEAAIKNQNGRSNISFKDLALTSLDGTGIDLNNSSVSIDNSTTAKFVSPIIQKDQQYTIYLAKYDNGVFDSTIVTGTMNLYYGSDNVSCDSIALEYSFLAVALNTYTMPRYVADTGSIIGVPGIDSVTIPPHDINGVTFTCVSTLTVPNNAKLLFVRVIGPDASTRIGIDDNNFPAQGKTFSSEAKTASGVVKKVKVFQSYPQIPAEMFVTSYVLPAND
ncbi:MAG: hypothetical protein ABIO02_02020 [Patescibacteria group bacterium]